MRRFAFIGAAVVGLAFVALIVWSEVIVADVQEPPFEVVQQDGDFEVRRYPQILLASVTVDGDRSSAASRGFRLLADYIFGGNTPETKIDMTAPVLQEPEGQEIAMTAPVIQEPAGTSRWIVRFVMPEEFTLNTLPKPNDDRVELTERPAMTMAVQRFSGFNTEARLNAKASELLNWMADKDLEPEGPPRFAFYDPPWTLPFLKRNEVMVPLAN